MVSLPVNKFQTNEFGGRADFAINPRLFGSCFGYWNNEDEEIILNFRVNWIPLPVDDFFLYLINQLIQKILRGGFLKQ